jgi:hypothetical protein
MNEAHHDRASRPSRLKKDSKTAAGKQDNEDGTNSNDLRQARALRPSRCQKEKKSKNGQDESAIESNEASVKPRGRLVPSNDSNTDENLRKTNWRRYRQENESAEYDEEEVDIVRPGAVRVSGLYGNDSDNEGGQDEDEESDDTQPGAERIPGPRMELYNDDNTICIGTINGDDQSNTNRNIVNPTTRENQPVMDAYTVPTAEVIPANKTATETTGGRHIWICLCVLVLVGGAVGVALGLTGGGDADDDISTVTPTDSPTQSPTLFVVPECSGFEKIDPDIENLDEKTFALYTDLLLPLVQELVPDYSEPMKAQEYCSAAHLALVWLANDSLDSDYPQKVLKNRFLLAFLFVEWEGYSWRGNGTGWLSESPECDWYGISCDEFGSIHELDITSQSDNRNRPDPLTIPSEIGHFTDLSKLAAIHWTRFLQWF